MHCMYMFSVNRPCTLNDLMRASFTNFAIVVGIVSDIVAIVGAIAIVVTALCITITSKYDYKKAKSRRLPTYRGSTVR